MPQAIFLFSYRVFNSMEYSKNTFELFQNFEKFIIFRIQQFSIKPLFYGIDPYDFSDIYL